MKCRLCRSDAQEADPLHTPYGTALLCAGHLSMARDAVEAALRVSFYTGGFDDRDESAWWAGKRDTIAHLHGGPCDGEVRKYQSRTGLILVAEGGGDDAPLHQYWARDWPTEESVVHYDHDPAA